MNKKENTEKETWWGKHHVWILGIIFAIAIIATWGASWYYLCEYPKFKNWSDRGTFGDMFGAVNALFSGLAFVGVIIAILLQRQELKYQRDELKLSIKEQRDTRKEFEQQNETMLQQRFENTFFNMLELHKGIIRELKHECDEGQEAMLTLSNILESEKRLLSVESISNSIILSFQKFKERYGHSIDHYFRNLYNIIKFVDRTESLSLKNKKVYTNLLRSQLSDAELILLFYNCLSCDDYAPFKLLLEKYSILKHLKDMPEKEKELYQSRAFDKNGNFEEK